MVMMVLLGMLIPVLVPIFLRVIETAFVGMRVVMDVIIGLIPRFIHSF
jgi:hypothetical protein